MELVFPANKLLAIKMFAAKHDVRTNLMGVHIEVGKKGTRLVATDGLVLGIGRFDFGGDFEVSVTIPNPLFDGIKSSDKIVVVEIGDLVSDSNAESRHVRVTPFGSPTVSGHSFGLSFPNYRMAIPSGLTGDVAQFDHTLLQRIGRAVETWSGSKKKRFVLHHNGDRPAVIDIGDDDFFGLVMPMKAEVKGKEVPSWVRERVE